MFKKICMSLPGLALLLNGALAAASGETGSAATAQQMLKEFGDNKVDASSLSPLRTLGLEQYVGVMILMMMILLLVLLIISIMLYVFVKEQGEQIAAQKRRLDDLEKSLSQNAEAQQQMSGELHGEMAKNRREREKLHKEIKELTNRLEQAQTEKAQFEKIAANATNATKSAPESAAQPLAPPPVADDADDFILTNVDDETIRRIVRDYNELRALRVGGDRQEMSDKEEAFINNYSVEYVVCKNAAERLNVSGMPPQFAFSEVGRKASYWAARLSNGVYAFMPSPHMEVYDAAGHETNGLKEAFVSNYGGRSYKNIELVEPAIINGKTCRLLEKGKLNLS